MESMLEDLDLSIYDGIHKQFPCLHSLAELIGEPIVMAASCQKERRCRCGTKLSHYNKTGKCHTCQQNGPIKH